LPVGFCFCIFFPFMNSEDNKVDVFNFRSGLKHLNETKALQY